jgi:hypothetical protein
MVFRDVGRDSCRSSRRVVKESRVPRYYFNMVDGHSENLVKDSEGTVFAGVSEARKEALGLARDVARHGFHRSTQAWQIVVTDETGTDVLAIPLSEVRAGKLRAWFDLGGHIAHLQPGFGTRMFVSLTVAAVLTIIVQAAFGTLLITGQSGRYQVASAPTEGATVLVRFVPDARMADVTQFLNSYGASLNGGPRPGGFYRLSLADKALPQDELAKIAGRMMREKIVEFAAIAP